MSVTFLVHPSCLEVGEDVPDRDGAWQCSQCKSCSVCDEAVIYKQFNLIKIILPLYLIGCIVAKNQADLNQLFL